MGSTCEEGSAGGDEAKLEFVSGVAAAHQTHPHPGGCGRGPPFVSPATCCPKLSTPASVHRHSVPGRYRPYDLSMISRRAARRYRPTLRRQDQVSVAILHQAPTICPSCRSSAPADLPPLTSLFYPPQSPLSACAISQPREGAVQKDQTSMSSPRGKSRSRVMTVHLAKTCKTIQQRMIDASEARRVSERDPKEESMWRGGRASYSGPAQGCLRERLPPRPELARRWCERERTTIFGSAGDSRTVAYAAHPELTNLYWRSWGSNDTASCDGTR